MSIHIRQVLDYLDTHPIIREADSMPSVLEALHEVFAAHNRVEPQQFRESLAMLSPREFDAAAAQICDLCAEQEQTAFSQGFLTGMLLMSEVDALP